MCECRASQGCEGPWSNRSLFLTEYENPVVSVAHPLHLDEKLGLDPPRRVVLPLRPAAAQGVHLVDEDDRPLVLARKLEQVSYQLLRFTLPLAHLRIAVYVLFVWKF